MEKPGEDRGGNVDSSNKKAIEESNPNKREFSLSLIFVPGTALPAMEEIKKAYDKFGNTKHIMLTDYHNAIVFFEKGDDSEAAFKWSVSHRPFDFVKIMNFCQWLPEQAKDGGGSGSKAASGGQPGQVEAGGGSGSRPVCGGLPGQFDAGGAFGGQEGFEELNPKRRILLLVTFAAGTALPEKDELMEAYARFGSVKGLLVLGKPRSFAVAYGRDDESEKAFRWSVNDCPFKFECVANFCEWQGISASRPSGQVEVGGSGNKAAVIGQPWQATAGGGWGSRAAAVGQPGQTEAAGSGSRAAAGGGDENAASLLKTTRGILKVLANTLQSCYVILNDEEKARLKEVIKKLEGDVEDASDSVLDLSMAAHRRL